MIGNTLRGETTITIGKKTYPCKLNMNAFRIMTQTFKVKLPELDAFMNEDPLTAISAIGYCGVKAAEASEGRVFNMDFEVFCASFLEDESGIESVSSLLNSATAGEEEGNTEESGNE